MNPSRFNSAPTQEGRSAGSREGEVCLIRILKPWGSNSVDVPGHRPRNWQESAPKTGTDASQSSETRLHTQAHMDVVAEAVKSVYDSRGSVRGLEMVYEPKYLRFFQARFKRV